MDLTKIIQLVGLLPQTIATVEAIRKGQPGPVKRDDVKTAVLGSTAMLEYTSQLSVRDRKAFNKGLDQTIDGIVKMLNASEWRGR